MLKSNNFSFIKSEISNDFFIDPSNIPIKKIIDQKGEDFFIIEVFPTLFFSALQTKNRTLLIKLLRAVRSFPFQEKIYTHIKQFMNFVLKNQFKNILDEPFQRFTDLILLSDDDDLLTKPDKFVISVFVDFYGKKQVIEKYLPYAFSYALRTNNKNLLIDLISSLQEAETIGEKDVSGNFLIPLGFKNEVRISLEKKLSKQQQDKFYSIRGNTLYEFKDVSITERVKMFMHYFKNSLKQFKKKYF